MAEVTIPTGPSRALDVDRIATLAENALHATAREMRNQPVPTTVGVVYRKLQPPTVGYGGHRIPMPTYGRLLSEIRAPAQRCQEGIAFTDHLWEAGALPKTLIRDGDGVPDKDAWALFTWVEHIEVPFLYLCNLSATRQLCETGTFQPWHIDPVDTTLAARDIATAICYRRRSVKALCPVMAAAAAEDVSVSLAPGITIRSWSYDERCLFLTRYGHEYVSNDPATWAFDGLLEIDLDPLPADDQAETTVRAVTDAIDLIKWALMSAADSTTAFIEGGVVLRSPSGWKGPTIRRQDSIAWHEVRRVVNIKAEYATRASERILQARRLMKVTPELAGIIWFLGRAHNSATARDSLLEATIGLESILVADAGESTYKVRLHGSALLGSIVTGDVHEELGKIYRLRSSAAHGNRRVEEDFRRLAPRARYLLAKAIVATIELSEAGELDLMEAGGDLGKATTTLVRKRCLIPRR